MALFSIIIPVYNVEAWIGRCLESILADSCRDMEIILVDDGSTDGSGAVCDQYAGENPSVRVIHKENGGLSSARNAGLEQASGEWISFIDADDWVDSDLYSSIRELLSALEGRKPDLIKFGYQKSRKGEDRETVIPCVPEGMYEREDILKVLLPCALGSGRISDSTIHTFVLSACAHVYRHAFLKQTGVRFISEREVGSEDYLFLYSLYIRADAVCVTHRAWYHYDTREGSLTRRYRSKLQEQYGILGDRVYQELQAARLETQLASAYWAFYIELKYICVMNECEGPGGYAEQVRRVRRILKDPRLHQALKGSSFSDAKSRLIAGCMRLRAALPLCMIQWKKTEGIR